MIKEGIGMKSIADLLGKRALLAVKIRDGSFNTPDVEEYKILEISPSGNWVKLISINGYKFWKAVMNVRFVEELQDFKIEKPPATPPASGGV